MIIKKTIWQRFKQKGFGGIQRLKELLLDKTVCFKEDGLKVYTNNNLDSVQVLVKA